MTRDGFSCSLVFFCFFFFLISPGEAPRTTLQEEIFREILDLILFYSTSAPRLAPHLTPIILMHKTLLFAGHLPMIIYDFGIHGLFVAFEQNYLSPIFITSASDWIRLLFFFFFLLEAVNFID